MTERGTGRPEPEEAPPPPPGPADHPRPTALPAPTLAFSASAFESAECAEPADLRAPAAESVIPAPATQPTRFARFAHPTRPLQSPQPPDLADSRLPAPIRRLNRLNRLGQAELGDPLRKLPFHWPVLAFWAAFWCNIMISRTRVGRGWNPSWHFAAGGARLLFQVPFAHGGGLALFVTHPDLQSGPLTFILAEPITLLGAHNGLYSAQVFMTSLGLVALLALERAAFAYRSVDTTPSRIRWTVLGGGFLLLPVWAYAGVFWGHFDDVLALLFAALAVWAVAARRPLLVGLCLALAIDSKPWAAGFGALLLAVPGNWSRRSPKLLAVALLGAVVAALWLPFVIADPHTLDSLSGFTIRNTQDSALRALGVTDPGTPSWDRGAQILFGCALGAVALWRRRWPAIVLLGVCARLILEPGDYPYYYLGLLVGALAWDLLAAKRPAPIGTMAAAGAFFALVPLAAIPKIQGQCKLGAMIVIVLALLLLPAARGAFATDPLQSDPAAEPANPNPDPNPDPAPDTAGDPSPDVDVSPAEGRTLHRV